MAADNDMDRFAIKDINKMEAARCHADLQVGVLVDQHYSAEWTDTRIAIMQQDNHTNVISTPLIS